MSRAGDIPEGSWICLSHRNLILAEDKRCSMFLKFLAHAQTFDRGVGDGCLVEVILVWYTILPRDTQNTLEFVQVKSFEPALLAGIESQ